MPLPHWLLVLLLLAVAACGGVKGFIQDEEILGALWRVVCCLNMEGTYAAYYSSRKCVSVCVFEKKMFWIPTDRLCGLPIDQSINQPTKPSRPHHTALLIGSAPHAAAAPTNLSSPLLTTTTTKNGGGNKGKRQLAAYTRIGYGEIVKEVRLLEATYPDFVEVCMWAVC